MKSLWLGGVFCLLSVWAFGQNDTPESYTKQQDQKEDIKTLEDVIQGAEVHDTAAFEDPENEGKIPEEAFAAKNEDFQYDPQIERDFGGVEEAQVEKEKPDDELDPELLEDLDPEVYEYFNIPQDTTRESASQKTMDNDLSQTDDESFIRKGAEGVLEGGKYVGKGVKKGGKAIVKGVENTAEFYSAYDDTEEELGYE